MSPIDNFFGTKWFVKSNKLLLFDPVAIFQSIRSNFLEQEAETEKNTQKLPKTTKI